MCPPGGPQPSDDTALNTCNLVTRLDADDAPIIDLASCQPPYAPITPLKRETAGGPSTNAYARPASGKSATLPTVVAPSATNVASAALTGKEFRVVTSLLPTNRPCDVRLTWAGRENPRSFYHPGLPIRKSDYAVLPRNCRNVAILQQSDQQGLDACDITRISVR